MNSKTNKQQSLALKVYTQWFPHQNPITKKIQFHPLCPLKTVTPSLFNDKTPKNLINPTLPPCHSLFLPLCSPSHLPPSCCEHEKKNRKETILIQFHVSLSLMCAENKYMQIEKEGRLFGRARGASLSGFLGALSQIGIGRPEVLNGVGRERHLRKWVEICIGCFMGSV